MPNPDKRNALQRGAGIRGRVEVVQCEPEYMYEAYWVSDYDPATGRGPSGNAAVLIAHYSPVLEALAWGYSGA